MSLLDPKTKLFLLGRKTGDTIEGGADTIDGGGDTIDGSLNFSYGHKKFKIHEIPKQNGFLTIE